MRGAMNSDQKADAARFLRVAQYNQRIAIGVVFVAVVCAVVNIRRHLDGQGTMAHALAAPLVLLVPALLLFSVSGAQIQYWCQRLSRKSRGPTGPE
jgi:hypothetical protein